VKGEALRLLPSLILCLLSGTGVGNGESFVFVNDTGEPAYGLSAAFDRPVEVRELGEGFAKWTLLEAGTAVVFFEGEVPARTTFHFSWTPVEARISEVRWLGRGEVEGLLTPRQRGDGLLEELCSVAWQPTGGPEGGNFTWVAIATSNPKIAYAGTNRGYLFKTMDGGASWERLERFHSSDPVFSIAVDPHNPDLVYVASCRIYRSCDGGATWSELDTPAQNVHHLAIHPSDPNVIYVGTHAPGSVYRSGDGGKHWRRVWQGPAGTNVTALTLVNPQEVYVSAGAMAHSGGLYRSRNGGRTWEKVDVEGAEEAFVHSIAVSPVDPRVIYVGLVDLFNRGRVFPVLKTVDGGKHWEVLPSFPSSDAHLVAVAPDGETVYVGSGGYLFRSEDGGETWERLRFTGATGPGHVFDLSCLAIDPSDPAILFLPTSLGVFRSVDGGDTWDFCTTGMIASEISHVVVDPRNPDRIYATSILGAGTFRSDDRGRTWERIDQNGINHVWTDELVVDPNNPDVLYQIADIGRIFKSDNGGDTWRIVNNGFRFSSIYALAVDPRDSHVVYAAKNGFGIFKSTDGGRSWTYLRGSPDYTYAIAISPSDPDILYAGYNCKPFEEEAAVYKSTDGGESWVRKDLGLTHPSQNINDIVIDPADPDVVYVAAMHNGVLKSTDGGETWEEVNVGLRSLDVLSLAIDPHDPEVLYAGLAEGVGVFKSTDGGETWEEVNNGIYIECPSYLQRVGQVSLGMKLEKSPTFISGDYYSIPWTAFTSVAVAPSDSRIVYASDFHHGLYRSEDGGASWRLVNGAEQELNGVHIRDIVVDPRDPDVVYVCSDEGVFRTEDGGASWTQENRGLLSEDIHTLAIARSDGRLYAGSKGYGVFRYEGRLRAWQQASELGNFGVHWPVWDRVMYQYSAMLIDPRDSNTIYIGTFPAGVFKSTDGGRTWVDKNLTFTNDGIMFLIAHPEKKDVIYAGTYNGVSRSVDGGESWEVISEGVPPEQWVFSIAFDPTNPDIMYAATKNGSNQGRGEEGFHGTVLKSLDGGETWFEITNGLDKNNEFYAIVVHPRNPNVLFLATQGDGVYVSTDAGESWQPMNRGLPTLEVGHGLNVSSPLKLDAAGRSLYLATNGFGVYRFDLPTSLFQPAQAPLALPDLAVKKVDLRSEGLVAGEAVRLVATIANRGNADVSCEVEVTFVLTGSMDSQIVLSTTVPGLGVGQEVVASVEWEPEAGEYTVVAEVDPADRIEEWNESNNRREGEQVLVPGRGSVCFHDDFERGAWEWSSIGLAWRIEREPDGNHVLRGGGSDGTYIGRKGFYGDDFMVEMRFCLEEGDFLIYFRHCDEGAYVFHLHPNGINIERFDWFDDREEIFKLGEASYPLSGGVWHTLQIKGEGPELSLCIDGKLIWKGTDSGEPFLAGGLFLEVFPDTEVRIDDVRAIKLP